MLRLGSKQRNKRPRNRNSNASFAANRNRNTHIVSPNPHAAHSASGSGYCCIYSSCCIYSIARPYCCIVSIRCPIAAYTAEARLLHLRHNVIAFAMIAASQIALLRLCQLLRLQHRLCRVGLLRLQHALRCAVYAACAPMRSNVLILQHPKPPIDSCCICNIIVRRVWVWGYRLLIKKQKNSR